ncbi:MAG: hypothetical protein ACPLRM_10165 [Anaerolineae bacterium]
MKASDCLAEFRAELIRLRRPSVLGVVVAAAILCISYSIAFQDAAAWTAGYHGERLKTLLEQEPSVGQFPGQEDAQQQDNRPNRHEEILSSITDLTSSRIDLAHIASTQTPLGSLGVSSGLMCSGVGFLALLFLGAVHVAGEWQRKTIKEFYRGQGQALGFVLSKFVSLFLMGLVLVIFSWALLTLWGLVSKRVFPIPFALSLVETWHWVYPVLLGLPVVLFFYAALGTALGILVRDVAGVIVGGATGFLVLGWLSRLEEVEPFSPPVWISTYMLSARQTGGGVALLRSLCSDWSPALSTGQLSGGMAQGLLGGLSVALLVASWIVLQKSDVMR